MFAPIPPHPATCLAGVAMGAGDPDKLGQALPGQEIGIDASGELPHALILDRTGTDFTPVHNANHLLSTTESVTSSRPRLTLSK